MINKKISKILIANCGEIAVRIIKTAKKMGIHTVSIHSKEDQTAPFVNLSDESYLIETNNNDNCYLDAKKITEVAKLTKSDAIHPGYGFLSENYNFAKACEKEKIIFIGPKWQIIKSMASKATAKKIMQNANIPIIPGYYGDNQDPKFLLKEAEKIGFPILLKASLGGGGKGMRVVNYQKDFLLNLENCKKEANSSFSDQHIILEKYIQNPRHIEVQILGDNFGNVIHLFERDCSIQRRHQKIIEEAPSNIKPKIKKELFETAINVAKTLNYNNAGTIEFIMDENENFYFMEVNTRLQVEHPVTEMITDLDLVEEQIKIANNENLTLLQSKLKINNHAIEARIYAEDPSNNFLPSTGKIRKIITPKENKNIRIDTGIKESDYVNIKYDPMLLKIIASGKNRIEAINNLNNALNNFHLIGLQTNISFLRNIINQQNFINNKISTNYIDSLKNKKDNTATIIDFPFYITAIAYFALDKYKLYNYQEKNTPKITPWNKFNTWRLNLNYENNVTLLQKEKKLTCKIKFFENNLCEVFTKKQQNIKANFFIKNENEIFIKIKQNSYKVIFYILNDFIYSSINNIDYHFKIPSTNSYSINYEQQKGSLKAPMHGTISKVLVAKGNKVKKNDPLLTMEAMKMEHTIISPLNGYIKNLNFKLFDTVEEGVTLLELETT